MIVLDSLPIFPECPTFGFTVEPRYLVKIAEREGGFERRDRKWSQAINYYTAVPMGDRREEEIYSVMNFWHAVGGMASKFRFKDWADYKSCGIHEDPDGSDQPFEFVSGSPGGYQMVKEYSYAGLTQVRLIQRPKGDTIVVVNQLNQVQAPSTYQVEEDTGFITPLGGFSGTPAAWGGEFYVPVRFDSELSIELSNHKIQRLQFSLKELRPKT